MRERMRSALPGALALLAVLCIHPAGAGRSAGQGGPARGEGR